MTYLSATTDSTASGAGFVLVLLAVATFVGIWKMFEKAGKPGWASLVPFYNTWLLAEMVGWPGWYGLYPLLAIIPIGVFAVLAINIVLAVKLAERFDQGVVMVAVLVLLAPIGYMILGFGDAAYRQPE